MVASKLSGKCSLTYDHKPNGWEYILALYIRYTDIIYHQGCEKILYKKK